MTHSLTNRHPYVQHGHHRSRGQMSNIRPRSPYAYPTRLKRPGYRPSSPALSLNRSIHSSEQDRVHSSRPASPAAMYNLNRVPRAWQQNANYSDPMLRYYSPVLRAPSSRGSTPKPSPSLRSVESSTRLSQAALPHPGAWPVSPTVTPPPLFYDYSEPFEEQKRIQRISVSIVTSTVPATLTAQKQEYWDRSHNEEAEDPVELPSDDLDVPIVDVATSHSEYRRSKLEAEYYPAESDPLMAQSKDLVEIPGHTSSVLESPLSVPPLSEQAQHREVPNNELSLTHITSRLSGSAQKTPLDTKDNQQTLSKDTESQQTSKEVILSEPESSSPVASLYSVQSFMPLEVLEDSTAPTSGADTAETSPEGPPRTPTQRTDFSAYVHRRTHGQKSETSKTSASITSMRHEFPEIVAPTPERSIVSLSNRERFSKILGLEEIHHRSDSPPRSLSRRTSRQGYVVNPEPRVVDRRLQRSLSPTPLHDHRTTRDIDSESEQSEHELTNGLLKTFGRSTGSATIRSAAERSPSLSPRPVHDSPIPLALRDLSKRSTTTPSNVRLSHRKTVINAGQRLEAKAEAVSHSSAIVEEQIPQAAVESSLNPTISVPIEDHPSSVPKLSLSIKTFAPPKTIIQSDLPFAFTPLIHTSSEDDAPMEPEATSPFEVRGEDGLSEKVVTLLPDSRPPIERVSTASPPTSRPWNLDASYPWDDDEPPQLDVVMPLPEKSNQQTEEKHPKFRLRIHRASSSNGSKLTKKKRSSEDTMSSMFATSVDLLTSTSLRSKRKPNLSIAPGQSNSSHDIIRSSPMQTRFVESFEQPSPVSPVFTLMPPSPAHDVRSFFSDDSSQARPKGSLRKRFSDFRTRNSRANSIDHVPGYDRGLLNPTFGLSRASGRSSRQSQNNNRRCVLQIPNQKSPSKRLTKGSILVLLARNWVPKLATEERSGDSGKSQR